MGDCITPATISDIAQKDTSRIVGTVAKCLAANSPYMAVLKGGVFASGLSDEVRSIVQLQAAPGDSLAEPTFTNDTEVCGTAGTQELTDATEFSYRLQSKRGTGPRVCVKKGYAAFKDSYLRAEDSLAKLITQYVNADIRAQLTRKSASKFVCKAGSGFFTNFKGGTEADIGVSFGSTVPDSAPSFKAIHAIARYMREALFAEMFPAGDKGQAHFRIIAEQDVIEAWRNETGVNTTLLSFVNGGYQLGEKALSSYSFESAPAYRGLAFATDQRPLRATGLTDGFPTLINPVVTVTDGATNTKYAKANPMWLTAPYGVLHIIAEGSFERQVPERYVGEGSFKFAPQLHMGELDWHYVLDNDCNRFGDYGQHKYQITRAYKPLRPQHIVSVFYKRAAVDTGLAAVTAETMLSSDGSTYTS
jgi:hypothetical protein